MSEENVPRRVLWGCGTSRTLRAHWMLQELELPYQTRPIGSRTGETQTPEFRALNPREKIPVLEDGDLVLAESAAIVTYLAERYGKEGVWVPPAASPERASYYEWCFFVMTELDAHSLYVLRRHVDLAHLYGEAPNAVRAAEEYFLKQVAVAEQRLGDGRPFLLGESMSPCDILLTTCTLWARHCGIRLSPFLLSHLERTTAREAYGRAREINFPAAQSRAAQPGPEPQ